MTYSFGVKDGWLHVLVKYLTKLFQCYRIQWLPNEWICFCKTTFIKLWGSRNRLSCIWNLLPSFVLGSVWRFEGRFAL